jgi:uncharacterized oxidoreductase
MRLDNRRIVITGATRGIGGALTRQLGRMGAKVIAVARNKDALSRMQADAPGRVSTHVCNLGDPFSIDALLRELAAEPDISVLINNAGIQTEMSFFGHDPGAVIRTAWEEVSVNLAGLMHLTAGLLPRLRAQDSAAIVNISSGLAIVPKEAAPCYSATKAGVRAFTRALRHQAQRECPNLLVNEVILPLVDTDMTAGRGQGKITPEAAASAIIDGLQKDRTETWVGKTRALRIINRISPEIAARMLR